MNLNRHFVCNDAVHIHRKLFLCRECLKPCKPKRYKPYNGHKYYKIAKSYACDSCDVEFVTELEKV